MAGKKFKDLAELGFVSFWFCFALIAAALNKSHARKFKALWRECVEWML